MFIFVVVLSYLDVLQVLDVGCVVAVPLAVLDDLEPPPADGVCHRASVGEELHVSDL